MAQAAVRRPPGWLEWLATVDHKRIGLLYLGTTFVFFLIGGLLALVMRLQLAGPDLRLIPFALYNRLFSMHGTTMIFLVVIPALAGFGNYLVPLMIGARDMAFPRLNAFSYWLYLAGGVLMYAGIVAGVVPWDLAEAGWTGYPPLSTLRYAPGRGQDFWVLGLHLVGLSSLVGAINFIVTIATMRTAGMSLFRLPLFVWGVWITAFISLVAGPSLAAALTLLLLDRQFGGQHFSPPAGDPVIWQHLFWYYSHPAVYIMILPAFGIISEILPVFAQKPIFGYRAIAYSTIAIGFISFLVYGHHMFTVGMPEILDLAFATFTAVIAVPTGMKFFNWLATLWQGALRFEPPLLFALGFLTSFLIGGITGIYLGVVPIDWQVHDTYFVVGHLHSVLFGGSIFGLFAGAYYWFPKMTGRFLSRRLGELHFWLMLAGFHFTFLPTFILGLLGMQRRIATYPPGRGWEGWNGLATVGAFLIALGVLVFLVNLVVSLRRLATAPPNPWNGVTLEWFTASPPPPYNFLAVPEVRSARPLEALGLAGPGVPLRAPVTVGQWTGQPDAPMSAVLALRRRNLLWGVVLFALAAALFVTALMVAPYLH